MKGICGIKGHEDPIAIYQSKETKMTLKNQRNED
jgi:hypothetical protein